MTFKKFDCPPAVNADANLNISATVNHHHSPMSHEVTTDLRKNLFILSGPSGCGKNTVYNALKSKLPIIQRAITVTTRRPRKNETHGVDYYFYTRDEFQQAKDKGLFAESALYANEYYATLISEIERYSDNIPVFLIIDTQGKHNINHRYPLATSIFLMPPSAEEAAKRLKGRGDNSAEEIQQRQKYLEEEIRQSEFYDYVVENNNVEECVNAIFDIVKSKSL